MDDPGAHQGRPRRWAQKLIACKQIVYIRSRILSTRDHTGTSLATRCFSFVRDTPVASARTSSFRPILEEEVGAVRLAEGHAYLGTESPAMKLVERVATEIAPTDIPVLL